MKVTDLGNYIYRFLILNGKVDLPVIGSFEVIHLPAINDLNKQKLLPPSTVTKFSTQEIVSDPAHLLNYLVRHLNISSEKASELFLAFCSEIKKNIDDGSSVIWKGIGTLEKDSAGIIFLNTKANTPDVLNYIETTVSSYEYDEEENSNLVNHDGVDTSNNGHVNNTELLSFNISILLLTSIIFIFLLIRYSYGNFRFIGSRFEKVVVDTPPSTYKVNF